MSRTVNKVILVGFLGDDPRMVEIGFDKWIANLCIATNHRHKDNEVTEWHDIVVFNQPAKVAGQYLTKGSSVYIEGRIQTRMWHDHEGVENYCKEIVVDGDGELVILNTGNRGDDYE